MCLVDELLTLVRARTVFLAALDMRIGGWSIFWGGNPTVLSGIVEQDVCPEAGTTGPGNRLPQPVLFEMAGAEQIDLFRRVYLSAQPCGCKMPTVLASS